MKPSLIIKHVQPKPLRNHSTTSLYKLTSPKYPTTLKFPVGSKPSMMTLLPLSKAEVAQFSVARDAFLSGKNLAAETNRGELTAPAGRAPDREESRTRLSSNTIFESATHNMWMAQKRPQTGCATGEIRARGANRPMSSVSCCGVIGASPRGGRRLMTAESAPKPVLVLKRKVPGKRLHWYEKRPRLIISKYYANNYAISSSRRNTRMLKSLTRFTMKELWDASGLSSPASAKSSQRKSPKARPTMSLRPSVSRAPKITVPVEVEVASNENFTEEMARANAKHEQKVLKSLGSANRLINCIRSPVSFRMFSTVSFGQDS